MANKKYLGLPGRNAPGALGRWLLRLLYHALEASSEELAELKALNLSPGPPPTDGAVIRLVPIGPVPLSALYTARNVLFATFIHAVEVSGPIAIPDGGYNEQRDQYKAHRLIRAVEACCQPDTFRLVGFIDADIYVPGTHFVFGTGLQDSRAAVIGLKRLAPSTRSAEERQAWLARRVAALVVSQVSAGLGLGACRTPGCARAFTNSLADLDRKSARLCPACAGRISAWLKQP